MSVNQVELSIEQKVENYVVAEVEKFVGTKFPNVSAEATALINKAVAAIQPDIQALVAKATTIVETELANIKTKVVADLSSVAKEVESKL